MATLEFKPGQILTMLGPGNTKGGAVNNGDGTVGSQSQTFGVKNGIAGTFPRQMEFQVIPEAGNSAFSVTIEHSLDQARGYQVVATITTQAPSLITASGGFYRATAGTATGGPVSVLGVCS